MGGVGRWIILIFFSALIVASYLVMEIDGGLPWPNRILCVAFIVWIVSEMWEWVHGRPVTRIFSMDTENVPVTWRRVLIAFVIIGGALVRVFS